MDESIIDYLLGKKDEEKDNGDLPFTEDEPKTKDDSVVEFKLGKVDFKVVKIGDFYYNEQKTKKGSTYRSINMKDGNCTVYSVNGSIKLRLHFLDYLKDSSSSVD